MPNQWLKLWHELPNDPKWRTIARASKTSIPVVQAVYLQVLVNASANSLGGIVQNLCTEDVASSLDIEIAEVEAVLAAMQGRVMDGDRLTGWERRQAVDEGSGADRTRKWREKRAAQAVTQGESVTPVASPNVTVTKCDVTVTQIREEENREEKKEQKQTKTATSAFVLPDWIDSRVWHGYEEMRRKIRKPMTDDARRLVVKKLAVFDAHGHNPMAVLNQSIENSWQGIFEIKPTGGNANGNGNYKSKTESSMDAAREAIRIISEREANCGGTDEARYTPTGASGYGGLPRLGSGSGLFR